MKPLDRVSARPSLVRPALAGLLPLALFVATAFAQPERDGDGAGATSAPARANARLEIPAPSAAPPVVGSPGIADPAASGLAPEAVTPSNAQPDAGAARRAAFAARPLGGAGDVDAAAGGMLGPEATLAAPAGVDSALPADADAGAGAGASRFQGLAGGMELLRVGAALGVVLAIAVVLSRLLKRHGGLGGAGRPAGVLEVLARYPVGRGQTLLVLRLDRRIVLVHQGGGRMDTLTEITDPGEVASLVGRLEAGASGSEAARFRTMLDEFQHGRGPGELSPDGRLPGESPVRSGPAVGSERTGEDHASGLAAAIRAGRRRAAYAADSPAAATAPAARPPAPRRRERDERMPEVEVVDLTRAGARGARR